MTTRIPRGKILKVVGDSISLITVYNVKSGVQDAYFRQIAAAATVYLGPYVADTEVRFVRNQPGRSDLALTWVGEGIQAPQLFSDGPNGQVIMNGATGVVVNDANYKPGRLVLFARVSGTATGSAPNVIAGVDGQFTVASVAGDTATYNYNIL